MVFSSFEPTLCIVSWCHAAACPLTEETSGLHVMGIREDRMVSSSRAASVHGVLVPCSGLLNQAAEKFGVHV